MNPLVLLASTTKTKSLPEGITVEVLNGKHDISKVRTLLVRAFVANNEPIVHALGELHYPSLSTVERIPLLEQRFRKVFPEQSLVEKAKEGLSLVAVKDNDPNKVVSVVFAEKYKGEIYEGAAAVNDRLCQTGLTLMRAVHKKATPTLARFGPEDIVFFSHGATQPEYQSLGIIEHIAETALFLTKENGLKVVYVITATERLSKFLLSRFGGEVIAEVLYKDYQDKGLKVFEKLSESEVSAKALIKCL